MTTDLAADMTTDLAAGMTTGMTADRCGPPGGAAPGSTPAGVSRPRPPRGWMIIISVVLAAFAGAAGYTAAPAAAAPAPGEGADDPDEAGQDMPCGDGGWGVCDTRPTDRGYQYRYVGGKFIPVPIGPGGGPAAADCGDDCPPDPAALCDLLLGVGPSPDMTPAELEEYNDQVAACEVWLADNDAVPLEEVEDAFADYLREDFLPDPAVTVEPTGRSFANLPTLFHTPIPEAFAFNVDEPVLATITAVPHYHWDFGDGEVGPDAPGRPYDPAVSPREHPEAYVSHGYAEPGNYQVTLTVTWYGSFTVPGVAQVFPLEPVVLAAADDIAVQEAVGVLTGND